MNHANGVKPVSGGDRPVASLNSPGRQPISLDGMTTLKSHEHASHKGTVRRDRTAGGPAPGR